MTITLSPAMSEALRLTRTGRLMEATALIQATLVGAAPAAPPHPNLDAGEVIDLKAERVSVTPKQHAGSRQPADARSSAHPGDATGRFEERRYAGPAGNMTYRLYIPAGARDGLPLVVMLHGCTQTPEDFARGTGMNQLADELGLIVAYPAQSRAANAQGCWNWFKPGHQRRDRGEPSLIAGITREVIAQERIDASRVYVAGLSAGGAAAAIMGAAYPDLYAAIGVHSGLACGAANDLPSALHAMRSGGATSPATARFVPVITFHGDRDTTVHAANSSKIVAAASSAAGGPLRTSRETRRDGAGRSFTCETSRDESGHVLIEQWTVHRAGHAWSGGNASGSYADPDGPDASREMLRFFFAHRLAPGSTS